MVLKRRLLYDYLMIFLGSLICAAVINFIMFPNNFSFGGSSGFVLILSKLIPVSASSLSSVINIVLMVLAFIILGRRFAFRTFVGSLETALFTFLLGFVKFNSAAYPAFQLLISAALIALATAILFSVNASSGGSDIVAAIINFKNPKIKVGRALFIADIAIVIMTGIILGLRSGITSFVGLFIEAILIDIIMKHLKTNKKEVIS